ncbi:45 kDa calcium-binding protein isoform X2 [Venturia canescens]|nr:45 kDa calcium-binding protein isoform X2 [Venturia canescens]
MSWKPNITFLRFARWTILVPLVIYVSLMLLVKYNKNMLLKSPELANELDNDPGLEALFAELETPTEPKKMKTDDVSNSGSPLSKNAPKISGKVGNDYASAIWEVEKLENHDESLLIDVFRRADLDESQQLDIQELARWIHGKITEHIERAMRQNIGLFTVIDNNPRNGEISWEEYHAHFLRSHGLSESYIVSHKKKHSELSRSMKESIQRDRARWAEAARTDPDRLALDEFLAFTHPESSHRALLQMVDDLFDKFDRDGDEQLTEDEFADLPADGIGLELVDQDKDKRRKIGGSDDRRKEFRFLIDKNKNGKADRTELLMYIDPRNPRHAIQEAQHLIDLSDTDHNRKLSLSEILSKADLFLGSKMVDTERSFHDEFR